MAEPLTAALAPGRDLGGGYTVQVVALDATTGAVLTGLQVTDAVLVVDNIGGTDLSDLTVGPFMLVPGPNT